MRGCKDVSRGFGTCHSLHKYAYAPQTFGQVICDVDVDADVQMDVDSFWGSG